MQALSGGLRDGECERVFNFALDILDAHTLSQTPDKVSEKLKFAAKLKIAIGSVLEKVEDENSRYCYAHQDDTLMERSKFVATKQNLVKVKNVLSNTDIVEAHTKTSKYKGEFL